MGNDRNVDGVLLVDWNSGAPEAASGRGNGVPTVAGGPGERLVTYMVEEAQICSADEDNDAICSNK